MNWRLPIILSLLLGSLAACSAQPKSDFPLPIQISPAEASRAGQGLAAELLAQKPERDLTNTGVLKIRDAAGRLHDSAVTFLVKVTATNWVNLYEAAGSDGRRVALAITHTEGQPNQYWLRETPASATNAAARPLTGSQIMVPFAGSDFWLADLGLEFLHWPEQRLLKKELRKSQSCNVLESTNPQPVPGGYARVVSWLGIDTGAIIHADAYDFHKELLKEFDPKEVKKIQGQYQLQEMEIRNRHTHSRTSIEFKLP